MKSQIKFQKVFALPTLVFVVLWLIPQLPMIAGIGIALVFLYFELAKLNRLFITDSKLEIQYPWRPMNSKFSFELKTVEEVIYVDRKKAVRGTYPHSHLVFYFDDRSEKEIKIMLNAKELEELQNTLSNHEISFDKTREMIVKTI